MPRAVVAVQLAVIHQLFGVETTGSRADTQHNNAAQKNRLGRFYARFRVAYRVLLRRAQRTASNRSWIEIDFTPDETTGKPTRRRLVSACVCHAIQLLCARARSQWIARRLEQLSVLRVDSSFKHEHLINRSCQTAALAAFIAYKKYQKTSSFIALKVAHQFSLHVRELDYAFFYSWLSRTN